MAKTEDRDKRLQKAAALLALAAAEKNRGQVEKECPQAEQVAAFLDKTCSEQEAFAFKTHLAECESCFRLLMLLSENEMEKNRSSSKDQSWIRKYRYIGSALALAASIAVFINIREQSPVIMTQPQEAGVQEENVDPLAGSHVQEDKMQVRKTAVPRSVKPQEPQRKLKQEEKYEANKVLDEKKHDNYRIAPSATMDAAPKSATKLTGSDLEAGAETEPDAGKETSAEFRKWQAELRAGCLSEQQNIEFWKELQRQAEMMVNNRDNITLTWQQAQLEKLLPHIDHMAAGASSDECRQIMQLLAQEAENK